MEKLLNSIINETNIEKELETYLTKKNKTEYKTLIENLIKLSKLHNEIGYTTPILTLIKIENNTFEFNIKDYINLYNTSTSELEKELYLNILKSSKKVLASTLDQETQITNTIIYLKKLIEIVKQKGILLLNQRDEHTTYIIKKASDEIEEIETHTIFTGVNQRIVLRYITNEKIKIKETLNKAKFYYNKGQFEEAIKEYSKIVKLKKQKTGISTYVYIKLGLAHTKLKNYDIEKDYITLAIHLLKESPTKTYLLETLEKLERKEETNIDEKTYVVISEDEFLKRELNNIENIIYELLKEGNNLLEIINSLKLNEEEILLAKIIQAQIYYENEFYTLGDKELKQVERSKNKTGKIITELTQTRKDKKLFKHRTL